ncbi:hypothetical protein GUJ93_ZPchr0004g39888 [Zizania palustris]|uniref:Uncharacterized protein n=1 Tax=Zizania palustris TaxID=103762 RepID=A0A8J5SNR1_ZIZPA|nr:hypothetical protein GUJ93_ZPchr0004g39888 [Zizania palustris]
MGESRTSIPKSSSIIHNHFVTTILLPDPIKKKISSRPANEDPTRIILLSLGLFHGHSYVLVCADFGGFQ